MKRLISLFLIIIIAVCLGACGKENNESDTDKASYSSNSSETDISRDDGPETASGDKAKLSGDGSYVAVAPSGSNVTISSTDDFKNYSVGYIDDCDSAVYAEMYDFKSTGMYNASNDAHSGMTGGDVDIIIIDKLAVLDTDKIVWDFADNK